jgi:Protein of unknown function (DUF2891)
MRLTSEIAASFARETLSHITREYPQKLDHVLNGPEDVLEPHSLHPVFHGSFDWHSNVHGWWQLLRIARMFPDLAESATIRTLADQMLVTEKVAGELAYLARAGTAGFERPYGWAWLLALHREAERHDAGWGAALSPLASAFAERFREFLPKLTYPLRAGTHSNIAFALILTLEWAKCHDPALVALINERAQDWFNEDRNVQAWEPSGDEFLSPALCEALLMSRVLTEGEFRRWFDAFLPHIAGGEPLTLLTPAIVSDRNDGKLVHLDGLNLSRAWCWRALAAVLGPDHPARTPALAAAEKHIAASLDHIGDDYMGSHWLASFALMALEGD